MASLYLSDIINRAGLDPKKVMLIRHSLNDKDFAKCYERDFVLEYTRHQGEKFAKDAEYWIVFVSDKSTKARFYACYQVDGPKEKADPSKIPDGFPFPEWYEKENEYLHSLKKSEIMSDMEGRLVIEWGKATTAWYQWGYNEKEIVSIQSSQIKEFEGFENLILSYDQLKEILEDGVTYANWHSAMSSVYAVYLIADKVDGQLYVGSAYAENGGLFSRWSEYVKTKHGNNVLMKKKLQEYPERYHDFQFQVLQILPTTMTNEAVIKTETLWKNKLLSKQFGMNDN